jgi:hypothetical protein
MRAADRTGPLQRRTAWRGAVVFRCVLDGFGFGAGGARTGRLAGVAVGSGCRPSSYASCDDLQNLRAVLLEEFSAHAGDFEQFFFGG